VSREQERAVLVVLAVLGAAHEIYTRQRVADRMLGADTAPPRAQAYHGAMTVYRKAAEWFGRQALRAERSYWEEMTKHGH
jgi:hypothetical protein